MPDSHERPRDFALGAIGTLVATAITVIWLLAVALGLIAMAVVLAVFLTFIALIKGLELLQAWAFSRAWSPW